MAMFPHTICANPKTLMQSHGTTTQPLHSVDDEQLETLVTEGFSGPTRLHLIPDLLELCVSRMILIYQPIFTG
jgi:hypothetical protein